MTVRKLNVLFLCSANSCRSQMAEAFLRKYGGGRFEAYSAGLEPSEVGLRMDEEYGIMCRPGLHCAPSAHKTIDTFPRGTMRFGLGFFTTADEVDQGIVAVEQMASEGAK